MFGVYFRSPFVIHVGPPGPRFCICYGGYFSCYKPEQESTLCKIGICCLNLETEAYVYWIRMNN